MALTENITGKPAITLSASSGWVTRVGGFTGEIEAHVHSISVVSTL